MATRKKKTAKKKAAKKATRTKGRSRKSGNAKKRERSATEAVSTDATSTSEGLVSGEERDPIQAEAAREYKRHARRDGVFSCSVRSCTQGSRVDGRASNVDDGRAWWVPACHDWFCSEQHADEYMRDRYG